MKNLLNATGLLAALGLLVTVIPSEARAEKTLGEQCHDRGGMWVGDPINSQSTGFCLLALTASGNVSRAAKCKAVGGMQEGPRCKLPAAAFSRFIKQAPR